MNNGSGFVKAYSNNWLSQFGIYKYESPVELPPKRVGYQHRKIALYGILAMAFVLFFILFVIINKSEADRRSQLIMASFSNETSIESSMGHTVLTTPFSSNGSLALDVGNNTDLMESNNVIAEARKQRRTRRLGSDNPAVEFNDNLVLFPSEYLKPPKLGSMRRFSEDYSLADNYQLVKNHKPRPFGFESSIVNPEGFSKQNLSYAPDDISKLRSSYGMVNNIQDVLNQLSSTKNQQYKYVPHHLQQPSEFSNPVFRNHRVKFSGIYRHPRKNGDITTLFGASSKQHELHVSKPLDINSQLSIPTVYMPDALYNFRPANPSDINLLATDQFRFAPEKGSESLPKGMPFSIMLDVLPMAEGNLRFKRPFKKRPVQNYANTNFPSYFNNQNFAQVQHATYNQPAGDTYFRSSSSHIQPQQLRMYPTMKPGKLMVHLNLYPKKPVEASRKYEVEKTALEINQLQLNVGESLPDPEAHLVDPTTTPSVPDFLEMIYGVKSLTPTIATSTSVADIASQKRTVLVPVRSLSDDQEQSESFTNENVAMGRYPPYRMMKKRLQEKQKQQEQNDSVDPRSLDEPPKSTKLNLVNFDANDAV